MSRIVPLTGDEQDRLKTIFHRIAREIHTTEDQHRFFFEDYYMAPIWHGAVGSEADMLALSTTKARSVWPFDACFRTDTGSVWLCINRSDPAGGAVAIEDWFEFPGGATATGADFLDGKTASDELVDEIDGGDAGSPPTDEIDGNDEF